MTDPAAMKCVRCGYESRDIQEFCWTDKLLNDEWVCRPCNGFPLKPNERRELKTGAITVRGEDGPKTEGQPQHP